MAKDILEVFLNRLIEKLEESTSRTEDIDSKLGRIIDLLEDILNELKDQGRNLRDIESAVKRR